MNRVITIVLTFLVLLSGNAVPQEVRDIPEQKKTTIYFSAITLYHPIVMYQKYQPLMNYLTENTPYTFELKLSQDYRDIIDFLKSNKVQVALLGGVTYLEAKKEFDVTPILKPLGP
ncbi:MAG: PhnD/SsuA/transferrin family substrate-binding protein, partial [Nitrospirae bacterium]|nr:PhnD/SsuA/transferrin family substrate-binding protein [Nitrospirota bacterium]